MGRLGAYSIKEAVSLAKTGNILKATGSYYIRNRATGKTSVFRIVK